MVLVKAYYPHGLMNLYKCPYCNSVIHKNDVEVLLQTNFKVRSPFLEELRISMRQVLNNAEQIIFLGYSLPPDDSDYRIMFKTCKNVKKVGIVLFDSRMNPNKFYRESKLNRTKYDGNEKNSVTEFNKAFCEDKTYFNFGGFEKAIDLVLDFYKN